MSYIGNKSHRAVIDAMINKYKLLLVQPGYLNYFLFKFAKETCSRYKEWRNLEGEIQQALREIYRRQTAPYEDEKIKENGDVK